MSKSESGFKQALDNEIAALCKQNGMIADACFKAGRHGDAAKFFQQRKSLAEVTAILASDAREQAARAASWDTIRGEIAAEEQAAIVRVSS